MSKEMGNQQPDDVEIWGINDGYGFLTRIDRLFEPHPLGASHMIAKHLDWIKAAPCPVYVIDSRIEAPRRVVIDPEEWQGLFGPFFQNSICYALASAILEEVNEIIMVGVEAAPYGRYEEQKPYINHFIWCAKEQGIKVTLPPHSLLPPPPYGQEVAVCVTDIYKSIEQYRARHSYLVSQLNGASMAIRALEALVAQGRPLRLPRIVPVDLQAAEETQGIALDMNSL